MTQQWSHVKCAHRDTLSKSTSSYLRCVAIAKLAATGTSTLTFTPTFVSLLPFSMRMPKKKQQDPNTIPTETGSAGTPQRVDRAAVRRRAESPNLLTDEELAQRQKKLRETRRTVPLPGATRTRRRGAADESAVEPPDVPETDCDEPPA